MEMRFLLLIMKMSVSLNRVVGEGKGSLVNCFHPIEHNLHAILIDRTDYLT